MFTIKNALLYIKNHKDTSEELLELFLRQQYGVSRVAHSTRAKGLILIDYQPKSTSLTTIYRDLKEYGIQSRIVAM